MNWKDRIEVNPAVLVGKPIIKGTRISVELILGCMANGWTMEDVLASYPHITREDVLAALSFVLELFKEDTFIAIGKVTREGSLSGSDNSLALSIAVAPALK